MPTNAVAFDTMDGPEIVKGQDFGFPGDCFVWRWNVIFFVTQSSGNNLLPSAQSGSIIQKVTIKKTVKNCDGTIDQAKSKNETIWEFFTIRHDASDPSSRPETNVDSFQIGFPDKKITEVEITLEASYHAQITGVTINNQPDVYGADGTLSGQPNGFDITLTRTFRASANCCTGNTFSWSCGANNKWQTYNESWSQNQNQEIPSHEKNVD